MPLSLAWLGSSGCPPQRLARAAHSVLQRSAAASLVSAGGDSSADNEELLAALDRALSASPRAMKRLRNLYRLAGAQTPAGAALAVLLATDLSGSEEERALLASVARQDGSRDSLDLPPRLATALDAAGASVSAADLQAAWPVARIYASRLA